MHGAGIRLRAEILAVDGVSIDAYLDQIVPLSGPFSTQHAKRLEQLRYALRSAAGARRSVTFRNGGASDAETAIDGSSRVGQF